MQKITPFLWYEKEAEEAAAFYTSIFPDSRVKQVTSLPSESPSGPPGSVKVVQFSLFGQDFTAITAGLLDPFNHAVSFVATTRRSSTVTGMRCLMAARPNNAVGSRTATACVGRSCPR